MVKLTPEKNLCRWERKEDPKRKNDSENYIKNICRQGWKKVRGKT